MFVLKLPLKYPGFLADRFFLLVFLLLKALVEQNSEACPEER